MKVQTVGREPSIYVLFFHASEYHGEFLRGRERLSELIRQDEKSRTNTNIHD